MQITSQIPVWHHCCIWRAMSWHGTLINCFWKQLTFDSQWLLMSGTKKASRPLMDSVGSLYRKSYFRISTKCLLKYMEMWFLKSSNWSDFLLLFQLLPTDHCHKVMGRSSCVYVSAHLLRGTNDLPPPLLLTHPLLVGLTTKTNCQSGLEIVNQVYTNVEYLW